MDDNTNLEDKTKPDNAVSIRITQRKDYSKILGVPIPFLPYIITNYTYSLSNGSSWGGQDSDSTLEGMVSLLINVKLNYDRKKIGPIHATLKLIGKEKYNEFAIRSLLKMYAQSKRTTITFENQE